MSDRAGEARGIGLPPWIWFWLILYLYSLPQQFELWRAPVADILASSTRPSQGTGTPLYPLLRMVNVVELIPLFGLLLGVITIFVPGMRARRLESRMGLVAVTPGSPVPGEMRAFLAQWAAGIELRIHPLLLDQFAFVYARNYRKGVLAIGGGLLRLWRSDQAAAEAILQHELAHLRFRDALVVGAGSHFRILVERWLLLVLVFAVAPELIVFFDESIRFLHSSAGMGISSGALAEHKLRQVVTLLLPGLGLQMLGTACWLGSVILLPLAAIWCAEFNADRAAMDALAAPEPVARALAHLAGPSGGWRWLLFRLSHPPNGLRQRMMRQREPIPLELLLLFPVSFLLRPLLLSVRALQAYLAMGMGAGQILPRLGRNLIVYAHTLLPAGLAMAGLLLAWPWLAPFWLWHSGEARPASRRAYVISGVVVAAAAVLLHLPG